MADLTISGLTKRFGDTVALDAVGIEARDGELLTLLGPSGCGKSTTLWSIAGLHTPDKGRITVGDTTLLDREAGIELPPEDRECGVVFQSYAVWPHMTVADNVAYPLRLRRRKKAQRADRVREVLELVELGHLADRYPHQLSGGQQQRVALARALAHPPRLLLLDEPFSNLDAKLRERARTWLHDLQREIGITTVFVTHDQGEALSLSDRIVVMAGGRVRQVGTPEDVYHRPSDLFVADFVGTINLLAGEVVADDGDRARVVLDGGVEPVAVTKAVPGRLTGSVTVAVRPEQVVLDPLADDDRLTRIDATVIDHEFLGDHVRQRVRAGNAVVTVRAPSPSPSAEVTIGLPADRTLVYPGHPDGRTDA